MSGAISVHDFTEETYWIVTCPNCKSVIEGFDDPNYEEDIECGDCGETIDIKE